MEKALKLLITIIFFIPIIGYGQQKDTLINKLDSLNRKKDTTGQVNNINPSAYTQTTQITFKNYFILLASDLKQEFTKPFHATKKDWVNFGKFAVIAIGLSFGDEPIQQFAVRLRSKNIPLQRTSNFITNFGGTYEVYTLTAFGAYGFIFKDEKIKVTTLLATQAYITGGALESVMKFLSGRTRPSFYNPDTEAEPRFLGPFSKTAKDANGKKVYSSFPSGHTTVAFAAATVFAKEYRNRVWVPIIAYTSATLIGLSRITENKHWATDVLVGSAVGYLAGQNIVNNYHRYAKIKNSEKKTSVTFNLGYLNRQLVPGVIYKF
jgi:membrane-associated phospholipid phosphatase